MLPVVFTVVLLRVDGEMAQVQSPERKDLAVGPAAAPILFSLNRDFSTEESQTARQLCKHVLSLHGPWCFPSSPLIIGSTDVCSSFSVVLLPTYHIMVAGTRVLTKLPLTVLSCL